VKSPRLSVIIPCLHDEDHLERLLLQLRLAESATGIPLQIIVVDAAVSERCQALCRRHDARWSSATPSRGEQLRQGAALSEHEVLWFLHADADVDRQALIAVRRAVDEGATGGYFAFRFSDTDAWQGKLIERLVDWRNRVGVPYGDQGIFARRTAYSAAGQHAPWPLFEEVPLVKGLRRHGPFHRLEHGLGVSSRRWQRDGWWRRACRNRLLALGFILKLPPYTLARLYTRKARTEL
jgi:glycosyltransferase involved in cell wall biosynthesis